MAEIQLPDHPAFTRTIAQVLLKHHKAAILWTDEQLRLIYISNNTYDLLAPFQSPPGLTITELCQELIGMEDILRAVAYREREPFSLEFIHRKTLDQNTRYLHISVYPVPDPANLPGLLLVIEDATQMGLLIQELNQKRNDLRLLHEHLHE